MVNFIEEGFQVNVHNVVITFIDMPLRRQYRLMGVAFGSETVASGFELNLEKRVNDLVFLPPGLAVAGICRS
jgi:hypothetical protein